MKTIQSIDRAVMILNYIAKNNNDVRLIDISNDLNLNKSTLHGIISTLEAWEYISQNQVTNRYSLGSKVFHLGKVYEDNLSIKSIANGYIQQLVLKFNETVHLGILSNSKVLYIDKVECTHPLRMTSRVGMEDPLHVTASGKVLLANISETSRENILNNISLMKFTNFSLTDKNKLIEELKVIKKQGFAIDLEELTPGINCIATPILGNNNEVLACISLVMPTARFDKDTFNHMKEELKLISNKISKEMGYLKPQ